MLRDVAGSYIVVPVGEQAAKFNGMITLNKSGAFLWNLLKNDTTEEKLTDAVMNSFEQVDKTFAEECVRDFLKSLRDSDLLLD